jgi:hypothetical protein
MPPTPLMPATIKYRRTEWRTTWCILCALLWLIPTAARAQFYFGKNKVQYTEFDWRVLATEHFDIYFYEGERWLADVAAESAERSYDILADRFNHHVEERVPLIIYSSSRFFGQTNIIPSLLPENVGGFTEFMKGRVVLPFNGSYAAFRHVLQHELVHVFTMSKLSAVGRAHRRLSTHAAPLWFTEGLAEYYSRPWQTDADMVLSDLVLSGRFHGLERMGQIYGTYLMYKEGESFCHFIAEEYGDEYLIYLLDNWWRGENFEEVAAITFGRPLEKIGREWEYWLKKKYYPTIAQYELPDRVYIKRTQSGYNVKPVPIRLNVNGELVDRIVFKGNRLGYGGLYMTNRESAPAESHVETLLKAGRSPRFESLNLLNSSLDVSPDGVVLFSSLRHEREVLYTMDVRTRKILDEYDFDSLYAIQSPSFDEDCRRIVFSGARKDGIFDLYLFEPDSDRLTRLTNDVYLDADPVFTPDGTQIVFASDRGRHGEDGKLNLYRCDLATHAVTELYTGPFTARSPSFSPDGGAMVFTSDAKGHADIYRLIGQGRIDRLTNLATGVFDPRYRPDGSGLVFAAYQNMGFQIYEMDLPDTATAEFVELGQKEWTPQWQPVEGQGEVAAGAVDYRKKFSFDLAQSAVSFDAFYGTVGGFQTALTDILGDHQYYFLVANNAGSKDEIFESFSAAATYFNRKRRLNYGYGLFHLSTRYDDRIEGPIKERQYGVAGHLAYPVSKYRRIETSLYVRRSDRDVLVGERRRGVLATPFLSLVHDNSLWDITGPIDGWRLILSVGVTGDLTNYRTLNRLAIIDARKYFRLGAYSAFAMRFLYQTSTGDEPQRRYFGGSWDLRGYPRRGEYTRNVMLISNELRFPLIDALFVGFPVAQLGFQAIRGAIFFDAGNAWEDDFGRMKGSVGAGARVALGYFTALRFDWARRTDFRKLEDKTRFEFFFGWNF